LTLVGWLMVASFLVLSVLGVPVALALATPAVIYILMNDFALLFIGERMMRQIYSFGLVAVPLFIFVGSIMNHSGISQRLFAFAEDLVGHVKGGLAHVNIVASLLFSGISGSAVADVGGIGRVLISSMAERGYEKEQAAALTSASATIGPIFPPSIPLIIYGLLAEVSVLSMLLAGAVPALLITVMLMLMVAIQARRGTFPENQSRIDLRRLARSFASALPALFTPIFLILGMLLGYFSPSEVAAVAVVYMLILSLLPYGNLDLSSLWESSVETARTSSNVLFILATAGVFSWIITVEGVTREMGDFLLSFSSDPIILLLVVNLMLLVLGLFLDPLASLVLTVPLVVPPLTNIGLDPVHIGVIMIFNLMIGLLTPPLGLSIFVASDVAEVPVSGIISKIVPYWTALLVALLVITFFPTISLWLPNAT
jgi:tripartite ATP-independent transporter DctM subunit